MRETKIPYLKAGEVITEGWLNAIVDRIERFRNLSTSSPYIRLWDGPYGKSIALALPQQTWARLSGSSSPYSFVEVRDGPGGTWVDMPNGDSGTANCYEVNGKANLDGKVVMLRWTAAGDWRFQWIGYGCNGNNIRWRFVGCNSCRVAGVNVDIERDGIAVFSGTTNSVGELDYPNPAPGTYDINWSIPFSAYSGTDQVTVTGACESFIRTITLSAIPGSTKCFLGCAVPYPLQLYVTDILGTRALGECVTCVSELGVEFHVETSFNAAGPSVCGAPKWVVTYTFNSTGCPSVTPNSISCSFEFTGDCTRPISIASAGGCSGSSVCGITSCLIHT